MRINYAFTFISFFIFHGHIKMLITLITIYAVHVRENDF